MPKLTIRPCVFETNSSSVHSLVIPKRKPNESTLPRRIALFDGYKYVDTSKFDWSPSKPATGSTSDGFVGSYRDFVARELGDKRDLGETMWKCLSGGGGDDEFDGYAVDTDDPYERLATRIENGIMLMPSAESIALEMRRDAEQETRYAARYDDDDDAGTDDTDADDANEGTEDGGTDDLMSYDRLLKEALRHPCRNGVIDALQRYCDKHGIEIEWGISPDELCSAWYDKPDGSAYRYVVGPGREAEDYTNSIRDQDGRWRLARNDYALMLSFMFDEDATTYMVPEGEYDYDEQAKAHIGENAKTRYGQYENDDYVIFSVRNG